MASLYDTYATSSPTSTSRSRRVGHSPTRTSRLRNSIVKLSCYLNGEADRSRATVVHLPEECDTLGEVIPKIHKRMGMDKRIAYAAELFLADGTKITSMANLLDAAEKTHAIFVGCGEPFDPTTVPYNVLETYLHGGGREGLKKARGELKQKQKLAAQEKADTVRPSGRAPLCSRENRSPSSAAGQLTLAPLALVLSLEACATARARAPIIPSPPSLTAVSPPPHHACFALQVRASGHGIYPNSAAVVTARSEVVDGHKSIAAQMRHEYMEQLIYRAEQQKALMKVVQRNTQALKYEQSASKQRRAEYEAERMARIVEEKKEDKQALLDKTEQLARRIKSKHDLVHKQYVETRNPYGPYSELTGK